MYNQPQAPLNVEIELNMVAEKSTRFVDNFNRMAMIQHKFNHGDDRKIIAFVKGQDLVQEARDAGAALAGGVELIKDLQSGELDIATYQYVIAHPNILPEMVTLRGLMKRKFPNPKNGTLGPNVGELVQKFNNGIQYSATKDENQQDFGLITTTIGTLDMDPKCLEENLVNLLKDVDSVRPKRAGRFVTRVILKSPPSHELLKIDPFVHIPETIMKDVKSEQQDEETEVEEVAVN
jgi:large subunit ribosomal protein L1